MYIDLTKSDLRNAEVGTIVKTTKGFEFQLVQKENPKEYWKDLSTGLTWGPKEEGTYNHHEALAKFGDKLPTKEQFEVAEAHGIREVLSDMEGGWFWSSSVFPGYSVFAYVFYGGNGHVAVGNRSVDYSYGAARCVSLPSAPGVTSLKKGANNDES